MKRSKRTASPRQATTTKLLEHREKYEALVRAWSQWHKEEFFAFIVGALADRDARIDALVGDLDAVWHAMAYPFDHCERCIADANRIKAIRDRLGPPTGRP